MNTIIRKKYYISFFLLLLMIIAFLYDHCTGAAYVTTSSITIIYGR